MRPRISRGEAAYLVTVLKGQLEEMKQKLSDVIQLENDYFVLIQNLKNPVQPQYNAEGYRVESRLIGTQETICYVNLTKQLKEEHPNLLGEKFRLWDCIGTHEVLLEKYLAIANGEPHDGRYKRMASQQWRFKREPEKLLAEVLA